MRRKKNMFLKNIEKIDYFEHENAPDERRLIDIYRELFAQRYGKIVAINRNPKKWKRWWSKHNIN